MDAIDDLSDAITVTRNFLTPIRVGMWVKLAIIVFFVSSLGFNGASPGGDFGSFSGDPAFENGQTDQIGEDIATDELILGLVIIGVFALVLWLGYSLIAGVMEFVFLESLRTGEVHMRRYFSANLGNGIRLFAFRVGVTLGIGLLASAPVAIVWLQGTLSDVSAALIGLYALYAFGLFLVYALVDRFTSEFVAAIMLLEDRGVLSAWSRFWGTLRANWTEYVVYLVLVWILSLAITIAAGFVMVLGILALLIPFGIVIFLLTLLGDVGIVLALLVGLLALAAIALFVALVWTPITTYFRYYALLVLGDTNDELDLIPDQRAAARFDGGEPTGRDDHWNDGRRDERDRSDRGDTWSTDDGDSWDNDSSAWDDPNDAADPDSDDRDSDDDRGW
ncbi:DUF7544 domain-containing protein [Natronorubrum halophilum]|uniref:DUF7544 domain-containing protein n=1 Tax=Natronorubrum halophilum TaxID=1702106 RepID=UPI0010C221C1|nr:hypothetical protein [Natronorubrum halophilum]